MATHPNKVGTDTNYCSIYVTRIPLQNSNLSVRYLTGAAIYSSDEDESDIETRRKKKPDRTKVVRALRDSDEESDDSNKKTTSGNESNAKSASDSGSDSD